MLRQTRKRLTASRQWLASHPALTSRRRVLYYWAPLAVWMGVIFAFSSLNQGEVGRTLAYARDLGLWLPVKDIALHSVEFGILAVLAYRLMSSYGVESRIVVWAGVWLFTTGYGATDEIHQLFVPGRDASWVDAASDGMGAIAGILVAETAALLRNRWAG